MISDCHCTDILNNMQSH